MQEGTQAKENLANLSEVVFIGSTENTSSLVILYQQELNASNIRFKLFIYRHGSTPNLLTWPPLHPQFTNLASTPHPTYQPGLHS